MSIHISNLTKNYGEQNVLRNISFDVKQGEIVGFLGPNGAGKSTTIKIITGYIREYTGTAMVCGINVQANPVDAKRKIGYLSEANPLYYDMYVREYLAFIAGVHKIKNKKIAIDRVLALTDLARESTKKIGQLSKGYKQRVGLSAALIHEPDVLLLDEPTSGLDPNQIIAIRNVIKQEGKNKTLLFSSHILQEVQELCDRILIIDKGVLVADDSLQHIRANLSKEYIVKIQLAESVDTTTFARLRGVDKVVFENLFFWLYTTDPEEVRRQVLQLAVVNKWNVISMQSDAKGLEQIFQHLTTDTKI